MTHHIRTTLVVTGAAALLVAASVEAQRRAPGSRQPTSSVTVALQAGGDAYKYSGIASCTHAPIASIYNLRAAQWSVQQSEGSNSLTLTVWHPASGADLMSLSLSAGGKQHSVNTVKVGNQGSVEGSGTVSLAKEGTGGTFAVNAVAANGTKITGTIKCNVFTPAVAEGGH